jgi:hypothetical protein
VNQGTIILNYNTAVSSVLTINSLDCSTAGNTFVYASTGSAGSIIPRGIAYYNLTLNPNNSGAAFDLSASGLSIGNNLTIGGSSGVASLVSAWPSSGSIGGQVVFNSTKAITIPTWFSIGGINQSAGTVAIKPSLADSAVTNLTSLSDTSGTLKFDFSTVAPSATVAPLQVNADASMLNASAATLNVTWASPSPGTYPLITFISGTPNVTGFTTQTLPVNGSLQVSGQIVNLVIATPAITAGTTLPGALSTTSGTASSAQSESVSGANLTANLIATAQTGFQVSSDGTTFGSTATYVRSGGNASGTLYVRLAASAAAGNYDSHTAAILSSTGASSVSVATTSSGNIVIAPPTITAGTTLPGALSTSLGTASSPQSESVSGTSLTADITATAQTGFEVSSDGATFGSTATYTQSGGNAGGTLYVRLSAAAAAGSYNSQTAAILSSTGASSVNVATTSSGNTVSQASSPVLTAVVSGSTLTLSWDSTTFPGYNVQAQTNSASVGLGSNWSDTGSGTVSPYPTTIDPANPTVFYRLFHP